MGAVLRVIDVGHFPEHADLIRDVITGRGVDLELLVDVDRLGTERAALALSKPQQIGVTPVHRAADLETVLVVERHEVRGIRQAGDRKCRARDILCRELSIGADKRAVCLNAETGISEHILQRNLDAVNVGIRPIHLTIHVEDGVLPGERILEARVGLLVDAANDEVGEMLVEAIDSKIGVRGKVPLQCRIEVVREVRSQIRIAARTRKRAAAE